MIREATIKDADEVFTLINELERNTLDKQLFIKQYQRCIEDKETYIYVYEKDTIIGCITLYIQHYLHHKRKTGDIGELIVKDGYRSLHIGTKLLDHVEQKAKQLGLEEISLSSGIVRKDAHRFYERHGYIKDHYAFEKKM